jgi:hypothetical protein
MSMEGRLQRAGPPFRIGDEVAFFPAEVESRSDPRRLRWDFVVIDDIDEGSELLSFHCVFKPGRAACPRNGERRPKDANLRLVGGG